MKFAKKNILITSLNFLTFVSAFFCAINSIFYIGFVEKHFYINDRYFLFLYLILISIFFIFKKISISNKLIKSNYFLLPLIIIFQLILLTLEKYNYPNFIYSHIHINPYNLFYSIVMSGYIFFLYNYKKIKKLLKYLYKIFYISLPVISVFLIQYLLFTDAYRIYFTNITAIVINIFLWFTIILFFVSIFKKQSSTVVSFIVFFVIFTLANYHKINSWNQSIDITDIFLLKNFKEFLPGFLSSKKIFIEFFISLLILVITTIIAKKTIKNDNPKFKIRFKLLIISCLIFTFPIFFQNELRSVFEKFNIKQELSNPLFFCRQYGILFCFYNNLENINFPTPKNYTQSIINQIYDDIPNISKTSTNNNVKPNIIVILSEALFDVTQLPNIKLSTDPIKNIRQDQKGTLISPQFGGATANVEFEIITGLSNYFMNGKVPYSQSIHQDMPTIFNLFKENGYTTTAIHPYLRSMFNRSSVYKHFGVEKFISIENMSNYEKTGSYVSAKSFTQEILKQLNSTNDPQLIFALSMQNHFPFEFDRFSSNPIELSSNLDSETHDSLNTYINGIYYSDQSYLYMKKELQKLSKPTIVILYGDHLPLIDPDFGVYKTLGFIPKNQSNWSKLDYQKMYSTPISTWSNYNAKIKLSSPLLSPNFLSIEILNMANITPKYQFKFINFLKNTDTILNQNFIPKFSQKELKNYELIQYDLIFGKQYGVKTRN
jgi:phosphoglycerol transferase MdoB-like AlkP superfamily enzyme